MSHRRASYNRALAALSLATRRVGADGNCLFRAVADQVYGDEAAHGIVRKAATDLMAFDHAFFAQFVDGYFAADLRSMRADGTWGDDLEVQALADVYSRPLVIYGFSEAAGAARLRAFKAARAPAAPAPPLRLSFFLGGHYDSVRGADSDAAQLRTPPGVAEAAFFERVHAAVAKADAAKAARRELSRARARARAARGPKGAKGAARERARAGSGQVREVMSKPFHCFLDFSNRAFGLCVLTRVVGI